MDSIIYELTHHGLMMLDHLDAVIEFVQHRKNYDEIEINIQ